MKKIQVILVLLNVLIIGITGMCFLLSKEPLSKVNVQQVQKEIIKIETVQKEENSMRFSNIDGMEGGIYEVLLKSEYAVDMYDNDTRSSENSIVMTNGDLNKLIQENQSENTEQALRAFDTYYKEHIFSEERLNGGDQQPAVQVFQSGDGTWSMIYDIKCGEFYEYETKLIRYLDGKVNETHLGYSDVAMVGEGFEGVALQGVSNGLWTKSIVPVGETDLQIRLLGNGHEEQMETGDLELIYEVGEDISIAEQYNGSTGGRMRGEDFDKQYDSMAMEVGVNTQDTSKNQTHWTRDVYDSYYYWLLESVE